jgi:hypothetical protein
MDAARVSVYIMLAMAGAVLFITGHARLPCSKSDIGNVCSQLTLSVVMASCVISGLLLLYSIGLGIVAYSIPAALLAKAPDDILENGLSTINSRTSLISTAEKQAPPSNGGYHPQTNKPTQSLTRHHAPQPLNLSSISEGGALRPVFSYTVTASPSLASSMSTPMSSETRFTTPLLSHPYARAELTHSTPSSPSSAWFNSYRRGSLSTFSPSAVSSTHDSSRIPPAPKPRPSVESSSGAAHPSGPSLARSGTAQSTPSLLGVPSQTLNAPRPFPNPFMDPISRSTTPGTPSTLSSAAHVPIKDHNISLSFGSGGFPLPPSYNVTPYPGSYFNSHASSEAPPATPLSLRPGVRSAKQSRPSVVKSPRPLSFGSMAASFHSKVIPAPPTPAAHLPPHPPLEAHLESAISPQGVSYRELPTVLPAPLRVATTPTSAKTFRSQFLPTDIPDWEHRSHR